MTTKRCRLRRKTTTKTQNNHNELQNDYKGTHNNYRDAKRLHKTHKTSTERCKTTTKTHKTSTERRKTTITKCKTTTKTQNDYKDYSLKPILLCLNMLCLFQSVGLGWGL